MSITGKSTSDFKVGCRMATIHIYQIASFGNYARPRSDHHAHSRKHPAKDKGCGLCDYRKIRLREQSNQINNHKSHQRFKKSSPRHFDRDCKCFEHKPF